MAAAEYYNPGGASRPPQAPAAGPGPAPQQPAFLGPPSATSQAPPYPMSDAPPPYQAFAPPQRPQSQPPPIRQNGAQQYQAYNPNPPHNTDTHQYPPEKVPQRPSALQNMYRPADFASTHPPQAPPPPANGYFTPAGPALSQIYNDQTRPPRRSSTSGYPTAQSPYRRDSRSPEPKKHRHHSSRPQTTRQKSGGVNTFLGAGGGAIIGDLIFPGLGTIGGAIIGGVGGHEYGKKRASSNPSRAYQQRRSASNYGDYADEEHRRGRKY